MANPLIYLKVNGIRKLFSADPERTLLSVLRDDFDMTGTKYGCGEGQCGACTVLLEGKPVHSCKTRVGKVDGKSIQTIEGVAPANGLHPLQQAFIDADAMQCAYCTSGMILSAYALLKKNPQPDRTAIVEAMDGNICRCGTYGRIVHAIELAAQRMKGGAQ
jgi:aerobic-type carbon monoxide dehydrogenase small subunit (CoxS/CutS family)